MAKRKVTITKIDGNWISGTFMGHTFNAKFFETGSTFGINDGRTSKLMVQDKKGNIVFNYDRGMDVDAKIGMDLAFALEQLPKMIVAQGYMVWIQDVVASDEFVDYVLSFYGKGQMYSSMFKKPVTRARVIAATEKLLKMNREFAGDSFDRELVRDIMLKGEGVSNTEHSV